MNLDQQEGAKCIIGKDYPHPIGCARYDIKADKYTSEFSAENKKQDH
jgi:hypothetical protein